MPSKTPTETPAASHNTAQAAGDMAKAVVNSVGHTVSQTVNQVIHTKMLPNPEPRWPAIVALLAVCGLRFALPEGLSVGPNWLLLIPVAMLLIPSVISHRKNARRINEVIGYILNGLVTLDMATSLFLLVAALPSHKESPSELLISAAALWVTNILVFASWYWRLDGGGPNARDLQGVHTDGAFLFPQMTLDQTARVEMGEQCWSPGFVDYLFVAFNTSTAFSPTDCPVLSRWAKVLMMVQALISFATVVLLAARACPQLDEVIIATDSEEIVDLCNKNHWPVELTSPDLPSGTDRVHAVAQLRDADIYVNIQGDEPLITPGHISALLAPFVQPHPVFDIDVTTLKVPCTPENIANPNAVKVVTALDGRALYFSRATIPYDRDGNNRPTGYETVALTPEIYWKHIGLYAYRKAALNRFAALSPSLLEMTERLEQLRMLENGFNLYVAETSQDTIGVDTLEDLRCVEQLLLSR